MREMEICAVIRKKRPYYGKKEHYVISDNYLNRDFYASKPNEKWVTDITYLFLIRKSSIYPPLKTFTTMKL